MNKPVFIFDMAGVLLDFDVEALQKKVADALSMPLHKIQENWLNEKYMLAEKGNISSEDYFSYYTDLVGLKWSYTEWINAWSGICEPNLKGQNLFRRLQHKGYQVNILSNLAENHKMAVEQKFPDFWKMPHRNFLSYELGRLKPDPEIYRMVCSQLDRKPSECIFFDDREENVLAAKEVGLEAYQFVNESIESLSGKILSTLK